MKRKQKGKYYSRTRTEKAANAKFLFGEDYRDGLVSVVGDAEKVSTFTSFLDTAIGSEEAKALPRRLTAEAVGNIIKKSETAEKAARVIAGIVLRL
ncbi:hypothetical protein KKH30_03615 [Candidatus Micrarchaeota archaeon]|nr:hypothetical protein [Candidatus Micrarchaeota archaeon]MBU1939826.1 hypothetical protein [Candidatus Micrarchaeota archaeon]